MRRCAVRFEGRERLSEVRIPPLPPGRSFDFRKDVPVRTAGRQEWKAVFEGDLGFKDPTPENNVASVPITVVDPRISAFRLVAIRGFRTEPEAIAEKEPFLLKISVENAGREALPATTVEAKVGGETVRSRTPSLPARRAIEFGVRIPGLPAGNHTLEVRIGEGDGPGVKFSGPLAVAKAPPEPPAKPPTAPKPQAPFQAKAEAESADVRLSSADRKIIAVQDDPSASGGKAVAMLGKSWAEWKVSLPEDGRYRIRFRIRGTTARKESAAYALTLDGRAAAQGPSGADWAETNSPPLDIKKGKHAVRISFANDFFKGAEDRNLFLDWIEVVSAPPGP